ncbi:MAG: hypothetical protein ABI835_03740 [Chloroflexota bacterium]
MNETTPSPTSNPDAPRETTRSPVRPSLPPTETQTAPVFTPPSSIEAMEAVTEVTPADATADPDDAINALRNKMALIADEFGNGKINRAQFDALYQRYGEQRTIIERLIERDPESSAWKQVLGVGQTGFLRQHFEAQALYYVVYRHNQPEPILSSGKQQPVLALIEPALRRIWSMNFRPQQGLGRRAIGDSQWLLIATGDQAATAIMFSLEPSIAQARLVRDLHADFERANAAALARGWIVPERMVFPQRALIEGGR